MNKLMGLMLRGSVINHMNGRGKALIGRGRKNVSSWMDTPDDVYFVATDATRKLRKQLNNPDFKKAARKPWRKLQNVKTPNYDKPVVPPPTAPPPTADPIVVLD